MNYDFPCVECSAVISHCLFCQDFQGCGQCEQGYTLKEHSTCGFNSLSPQSPRPIRFCVPNNEDCTFGAQLSPAEAAVERIGNVVINVVSEIEIDDDSINELNSTQLYLLSADDENSVYQSFKVFDGDNNNYLDRDEYDEFFQTISQNDRLFELIDIDEDGVISFREMVSYLTAVYNSATLTTREALENELFEAAEEFYDIVAEDETLDVLMEYSAALMFSSYDSFYKGYLTYQDFVTPEYGSDFYFEAADVNDDNCIDFNEFLDAQFRVGGLTAVALSGIVDGNDEANFDIDSIRGEIGYTNAGALETKLNNCPNMNLFTSDYYQEITVDDERRRRRLHTKYRCSSRGGSAICNVGRPIVCTGVSIFFAKLGGVCSLLSRIGCTLSCSTVSHRHCFSSQSSIMTAVFDPLTETDKVYDIMVKDVKVGDKVLTLNGFETVIHTGHYIKQDGNETFSLLRRLCFDIDIDQGLQCITMTYSHMLFVDSLDTLKPASQVEIGDIIFVSNIDIKNINKRVVSMIFENVTTQARSIFTQSGTIVVDGIIASSYTGNNKYDGMVQHFVLKIFYYLIKMYDESLIYDEYKMFQLRKFIYYKLVTPFIAFYTNIFEYICNNNGIVGIVTGIVVCLFITKRYNK